MTSLVLLLAAATQDPSDAIYDETQIRTFRLTMPAADWNAIVNADGETWRRAEFQWENETVTGVGVKASGHGTLTTRQKQSIRISFNEFEFDAQKRRWRGINRIKLDSMEGNVDHSMSRDRVAFGIMRAAGNAAPRSMAGIARSSSIPSGSPVSASLIVEDLPVGYAPPVGPGDRGGAVGTGEKSGSGEAMAARAGMPGWLSGSWSETGTGRQGVQVRVLV